jgi:imidazole glycerol-phosphate synthase subunit HisH
MNKHTVVIIDYGMGNIRSILNKINRAGYEGIVTAEINEIKSSKKFILPGVGHFLTGINKLKERNLIDILTKKILVEKTPILGICLGMQLFTKFSEEGNAHGLGWIDAETVKFQLTDIRHKVPHMGWNSLKQMKDSLLLKDIPINSSYYFVHSYHVKCNYPDDILTTSCYGYEFVSAIHKENIFGTQFHPEKSHEWGEKMLLNFLSL